MRRRISKSAVAAAAASAIFSVPAWSQSLTAVQTGTSNATINLTSIANIGATAIDAATIPGDNKLYVGIYSPTNPKIMVVDPVAHSVSPTPFLQFSDIGAQNLTIGQGMQGMTFSPNFNDPTKPGYHKFYTYTAEKAATVVGSDSIMFLHPEVPNPSTSSGSLAVVREWTANSLGTAIDTAIAPRVVLNFGTPAGHMGGGMKFGPDGYMYLSTGDGGGNGDGGALAGNTDGFTGRSTAGTGTFVPGISNGQDFTNPTGKVLRIDPYIYNGDGTLRSTPAGETVKIFGGQNKYFIPNSNPFVGNTQNLYFTNLGPIGSQTPTAPMAEIFAFGFRNPWKLSFDKNAGPGALPYVADVGSHGREEIDLVAPGKNYGWPYREGDIASPTASAGRPSPIPYYKQTSPGVYAPYDLDATLTDPTQMNAPIARLGSRSVTSLLGGIFTDHPTVSNAGTTATINDIFGDGHWGDEWGDINAVTGGYVYRGTAIPSLYGMYVFGGYEYDVIDPTKASYYGYKAAGGRLFYFDPTEVATYKTIKEFNYDAQSTLIPADANGLLMGYAQADNGELFTIYSNGDVKKINPNPGWNIDGDGSWTVGANWSGTVPGGVNAATYFGGKITAAHTIAVNGTKTVGALNFDNLNSYTLAGSTITLDVSGSAGIRAGINVTRGNHTIAAPLVLNQDTVIQVESGTSTLFMTGSMTAAGRKLYKDGLGTAQFENVRADSLTVTQGTAKIRARGGTPNQSDGTSRLNDLTIAAAGKLDLADNAMVIDYTSLGTRLTDLRSHLKAGRLTTSSGSPSQYRLGYGDNAVLLKDSFEGQDVSSHTNLLVKYTYAGDLNLDGQVDMTDLQALAAHWAQPSAVWTSGDIDYNGVVGFTDLSLLAPNWQAGVSSPLPAPSLDEALTSLGLPEVVPEPATAAVAALGISLELGRRRRRRVL